MAGHSKWAQIKRKKAVTDARRGKLFTQLLKEIAVAARLGGADADFNPRLRSAIDEAKAGNVPNDNIERAILRGTGELEGAEYEEVAYEGYGSGGVAILVEAVTDNRNRTVSELRHLFSRHHGSLGESGSVAWMFSRRGLITLSRQDLAEEEFLDLALELGVDDLATGDDAYELTTAPEDFHAVLQALRERGLRPADRSLAMIPQASVEPAEADAVQALRLLEALEEHDDVQNVWSNLEVGDEVLAGERS